MATPAIVDVTLEEETVSAVSWPAIFAGGVAAATLGLCLFALGAGIGFSAISPWSSPAALTAFKVSSGIYLVVTAMLASTVGGYLAGRLRTRWQGAHSREVFFRDTAHGLLAWAAATLLTVMALSSAAHNVVAGAASASGTTGQPAGPLSSVADSLTRSDPDRTDAREAGADTAARSEVNQILTAAVQPGSEISAGDRNYLVKLVVARSGSNRAEAEQKVSAAIQQAKAVLDRARKAAAQLALWLTASLFVGAFSASLAAIEGGGLRDGTWKYSV
jgi:hypothetical protein